MNITVVVGIPFTRVYMVQGMHGQPLGNCKHPTDAWCSNKHFIPKVCYNWH